MIRFRATFGAALVCAALACPRADAQTTWSTGATNGDMTNTNNWSGAVLPADNTAWLFTNSSTTTLTNRFSDYTVAGITFTTNATNTSTGSGYTIGGSNFTLTGGITNNSTNLQTISAGLTINSAVNLSNTGNVGIALLTLSGNLTGSETMTYGAVANQGRLTLSGNNSAFTGALVVNSGRLNINSNSVSAGADYTFNNAGGTFLASANSTYNFGSLSGSNTIANNSANNTNTISIGAKNNSTTFSGNISTNQSGTINVVKVGTGTQILSGNNNYIGATTISNGVLQIGDGGTTGSFSNTASITIAGGSLAFNRSDNITQGVNFLSNASVLSGAGGLIKMGAGTLTLTAANTYSGDTVVSAGALRLSNTSAIQSSALDLAGGALLFDSSLSSATFGGLKGSGNLTLTNSSGGAVALTLGNAASTASTYTGSLAGASSLALSGTGTQTLSGNNTYSGGTTLNSGTLGVGHSSALGSGALTVTGNSTLLAAADALTLTNNATLNSGTLAVDVQSFHLASSGAIGGTGSLTKTGTGTLTLTGANIYSGGTLVSAGTLSGTITGLQGNITNNAAVAFDQSTTGTYAGILSGSGSLAKFGSGTVILNAANTQSGGTLISAGTLQIGNGGTTGSLAGAITNNATLAYDRSDNLTQSTIISGTGSLTKTGNGTLTLSGNNTYSGRTTINGGAILINTDSRLGTAPGAFTADQLTLDGGRLAVTNTFGLNANRGTTLGSGGGTFEVVTDATLTISTGGLIAGTGTLTKTGAGTLVLAAASTFSGGFVLNEGWVRVSDNTVVSGGDIVSSALGVGNLTINGGGLLGSGRHLTATNITINNDFAVNSATSNLNGRLSVSAVMDLGGETRTVSLGRYTDAAASLSSGIESLRFTTNDAFYFPVITNGTFRFVRDAAGSASDYASVSFGVTNIQFQGGSGFIVGTNVIAVLGPSFLFANASGALPHVGTEDGGIFNLGITNSAGSQIIRSLSGTAGYVTSLGTLGSPTTTTLTISNQAGDNYDYGGQIVTGSSLNATLGTTATNVTFALTKTGAGTQILSGDNTYTGNTTISAGTLQIGNGGTTGSLSPSGAIANNGTLVFDRSNDLAQGTDFSTAAITGSGSLVKRGAGTLTLTAANTYAGDTSLEAGAISFSINNALGGGTVTMSEGTRLGAITGNRSITNNISILGDVAFSGFGTGTTLNGNLDLGGAARTITLGNSTTFNGAISNGSMVLAGVANFVTMSLTASNSFDDITVNRGILRLSGAGALSSGSALTLASLTGATELDLTNVSASSVTIGSLAGNATNATVNLGDKQLIVGGNNASTAFAGIISNTGSLTKTGTGTLTLTTSNSFSGGIILGQGTLRLDHANAAGSGTITQTTNNSMLQISATGTVANAMSIFNVSFTESVTLTGAKTLNNATLTVESGETVTEQGVLSGDGGLVKNGGGALVLNGSTNNTYTGETVVNAGRLVLSNSGGNAIHSSSGITVNSGGTLVLGADNQIGDGIGLTLNGGTFLVGASALTESLGTLTLSADSILDFGNFAGIRQITFADSSGATWATNAVLTITNWQGAAQTQSEVTQILFGSIHGLSGTQLGQIRFADQDINGGELLGDDGELVPVPEASVVWGGAAVALLIGWRERRRLAGLLRPRPVQRRTSIAQDRVKGAGRQIRA